MFKAALFGCDGVLLDSEAIYLSAVEKYLKNLVAFLELLKKNDIKTAVVSSSAQSYVEYVLEALNIKGFFDLAVGRENAKEGKPAPDLYLKAMEILEIKPSEAVVIEDSANGTRAGKSAGCQVIGYFGSDVVKQDISEADCKIRDYKDIDMKLPEEMIKI